MFSPYYALAGRQDPLDHCAVNIVLHGPGVERWAMTERRRSALTRQRETLQIGPSALRWESGGLTIDVEEIGAPIPKKIFGRIRLEPVSLNRDVFTLERHGRHLWRPIAPAARVEVAFEKPSLSWRGHGYFDCNCGDEPLEDGFSFWTWSRASLDDGAAIFYEARRRREPPLSLALRFDGAGAYEPFTPPARVRLPASRWRVERETRSEDGIASATRSFVDAPFYSRSLVSTRLFGQQRDMMHESLSLHRLRNPIVRAMLPFRMPRRFF